jgi:hypothetical protein
MIEKGRIGNHSHIVSVSSNLIVLPPDFKKYHEKVLSNGLQWRLQFMRDKN